jgi:hypothetical protein
LVIFQVPLWAACTANVPAFVTAWDGTEASETGTADARNSVSVSGPVTATDDAIETGCVAW